MDSCRLAIETFRNSRLIEICIWEEMPGLLARSEPSGWPATVACAPRHSGKGVEGRPRMAMGILTSTSANVCVQRDYEQCQDFYLVLHASDWLRYTKNMDMKRLKAILRAATFASGLGSRPANRFMDCQHHDSAHWKTQSSQIQTWTISLHRARH